MKHEQALLFWNSVAQGELLQVIPSTQRVQGYEVYKDTYSSSICSHYDLPTLRVTGSTAADRDRVALFLRLLASEIENDK